MCGLSESSSLLTYRGLALSSNSNMIDTQHQPSTFLLTAAQIHPISCSSCL